MATHPKSFTNIIRQRSDICPPVNSGRSKLSPEEQSGRSNRVNNDFAFLALNRFTFSGKLVERNPPLLYGREHRWKLENISAKTGDNTLNMLRRQM